MTTPPEELSKTIFKRSARVNLSDYSNDIKTFNVLFALDGRRTVGTIIAQDAFDPDDFTAKIRGLEQQGLVEPVISLVL